MDKLEQILLLLNTLSASEIDTAVRHFLKIKEDKGKALDDIRNSLYCSKSNLSKVLSYFEHQHYYTAIRESEIVPEELTLQQVAQILKVSTKTVSKYCREGLPHIKKSRKRLRILNTDLEAWQKDKSILKLNQ